MIELLVLQEIIRKNIFKNRTIVFDNKKYDYDKIKERYKQLTSEFLEPYIIDPT